MCKFFIIFLLNVLFLEAVERPTVGIFTCRVDGVGYWDPDSVNTGIAGSEEAVIYISNQLASIGYQVIVYGNPPPGSRYSDVGSNPRFIDANSQSNESFDIAVSWRMPFLGVNLRQKAKTVYLWPHDTNCCRISDEYIRAFNDVLWLSNWQREQWISINPEFEQFTSVFGNGIEFEQFESISERKNPHSCIYGSNYGRGLEILLEIWPEVKQHYPNATLDIYYGWQHWGLLSAEKEAKLSRLINDLAALSVIDHGKVGHKELNQAYANASIWAYPCIAPETFCITALRAQASGAIPVIIQGSALVETVQGEFKCTKKENYLSLLLQAMKCAEQTSVEDRNRLRDFVLNTYVSPPIN